MWVRNTDGEKDAVLTMALIGFIVIVTKVLLAGAIFTFGENKSFQFGTIDAATIAAVLVPTLGSYVARKYTDKKFSLKTEEKDERSSKK